jgi:hypothetical protein
MRFSTVSLLEQISQTSVLSLDKIGIWNIVADFLSDAEALLGGVLAESFARVEVPIFNSF